MKSPKNFWKELHDVFFITQDNINNTNDQYILIAYQLYKIANALEEISQSKGNKNGI